MDIFEKVQQFLKRSSKHYSSEISKQVRDLEEFNGQFWNDELKKTYNRTSKKKLCLHFSDWNVLANAIASPYSTSPWHNALTSRSGDNELIQEAINKLEGDNDYRSICKDSFFRGVVAGAGFAVVTTDIDYISGEPKVCLEFVQHQDSVALDPDIETPDCSDAEEGAIVTYMSVTKAKRLFGEDVLPFDYPRAIPKLNFAGISQWANEPDKIQVVSYYTKNSNGTVTYYKICGNKVIEEQELPIKYIPIVRFAGYQKYTSDGIRYAGIVDKTFSLQLGLNIAYSTLMERANRSIKANLIASTDAVEGLDAYYKKMSEEDGLMILHNKGTAAPIPLVEQFQTADLSDVINQTRNLIADVIGVPLSGIVGINDKTATEVMVQQINQESNLACFYDNAYKANRLIGRIIIEFINGGTDLEFDLENGPDIITSNMKRRQELQTVAGLLPPEMQPIVAVHMLDTIDSNFGEQIKSDVIANLNENIKLTTEAQDPFAIHQLKQMQQLLDATMQQLEQTKMELAESEKQNEVLNLEILNRKQETLMNYQKWQAEFELKAQEAGIKLDLEQQKEMNKTNIELQKLDQERDKLILEATNKALGR